jgi:eukaryotic-like serine/threonine-protein kinase
MAVPHSPEDLAPGDKIGRYEIVRRLAIGGMAEIYLARARGIQDFEKLVVLKRIAPRYAKNDEFVAMFLDEARLAATLHHPNIAQVYDIGADSHSYFFAMEFVDGRDLRHILQRAMRLQQPVPLAYAVTIVLGVAAGLHSAHTNRAADGTPLHIVHRDVSPANVVVTYDGCPKLIDFGIAKAARRQAETQHGMVKGKYSYMSPEQCRGLTVDRRSDVFSLGILLFELSTTTRLFRGQNEYDVMRLITREEIPRPGDRMAGYPCQLEDILMRALARDMRERYPTARAVHQDLQSFAATSGMVVPPYELAEYMRASFPQESQRPLLETELSSPEQAEPTPPLPVHRLSSPVLRNLPLRAPPRMASEADTVVAAAHQGALLSEPTIVAPPAFAQPPARRPRELSRGAQVALALLLLLSGWLIGQFV